jgi:4-oxalocrotonate tautomerase
MYTGRRQQYAVNRAERQEGTIMPIVRIEMWPGRGRDEKNALIRNVTDAVVNSIGCPDESVTVLLYEVDKSDWAAAGVCYADRPPLAPPSTPGV